jgi:predicted aspartyl protease
VIQEMDLRSTGKTIQIGGIDDGRNLKNRYHAVINIGVGAIKKVQPIIIQNRSDNLFDVLIGMDIIETLSMFSIANGLLRIG